MESNLYTRIAEERGKILLANYQTFVEHKFKSYADIIIIEGKEFHPGLGICYNLGGSANAFIMPELTDMYYKSIGKEELLGNKFHVMMALL